MFHHSVRACLKFVRNELFVSNVGLLLLSLVYKKLANLMLAFVQQLHG